jgi:hypothetical protein
MMKATPAAPMKTALILVIIFGIAASIAADYLWKRWMAERLRDRGQSGSRDRDRP